MCIVCHGSLKNTVRETISGFVVPMFGWLMPGREDEWRDFWTFVTGSSSSPWLVDGFKVVLWQVITAGSSHYGGTQTLQIGFSCMGCCGSPLEISVSPFIVGKNVAATEGMFLSLKLKTYKKIPSANSLLKRAFDCCQLFRSRLSTTMTYFANYQTPNFVRNHNCLGLFLYTWVSFTKPPKSWFLRSLYFVFILPHWPWIRTFIKMNPPPMNHLCSTFTLHNEQCPDCCTLCDYPLHTGIPESDF